MGEVCYSSQIFFYFFAGGAGGALSMKKKRFNLLLQPISCSILPPLLCDYTQALERRKKKFFFSFCAKKILSK